MIEVQRRDERLLGESKQMSAEFPQHFVELFGACGGSEAGVNFTPYLDGTLRIETMRWGSAKCR